MPASGSSRAMASRAEADLVWKRCPGMTTPGIPQYMRPRLLLTKSGVLAGRLGIGYDEIDIRAAGQQSSADFLAGISKRSVSRYRMPFLPWQCLSLGLEEALDDVRHGQFRLHRTSRPTFTSKRCTRIPTLPGLAELLCAYFKRMEYDAILTDGDARTLVLLLAGAAAVFPIRRGPLSGPGVLVGELAPSKRSALRHGRLSFRVDRSISSSHLAVDGFKRLITWGRGSFPADLAEPRGWPTWLGRSQKTY